MGTIIQVGTTKCYKLDAGWTCAK